MTKGNDGMRFKYLLIGLMLCVGLGTMTGCGTNQINELVNMSTQTERLMRAGTQVERREKWKNEYLITSVEQEQEYSFLDLDAKDVEIVLKKGDQPKYEIFSNHEDVKTEDFFSIEMKENGLHIKTRNRDDGSPGWKIVVYVPSPEQMKLNIQSENSVVEVNSTLNELNLNSKDSAISIKGEETFPIHGKINDTVFNMDFQTVNATVSVDLKYSMVSLPEDEGVITDGPYQDTKVFGNGDSKIDVTAENSVMIVVDKTTP